MRGFLVAVLLWLLGLPVAAFAEELVGFYMTGEASVFALVLPDYSAATVKLDRRTHAVVDGPYPRVTTSRGLQAGPMGALNAGWRTKNGMFFEAQGFVSNLHSEQTTLFDYPTSDIRYGWVPINGGNPGAGNMIANGDDMHTKTTRDIDYYGATALVGWDVPVETWVVSPFVGISCMELDQSFGSYCYCVQHPDEYMSLEEDLDAKYLGILAGVRVRHEFEGLVFHAEGKLGVYNLDADYEGFQATYGGNVSASDTYLDTCVKAALSTGVIKQIGSWTCGVNAGLEFLSAVPAIRSSTTHNATTNGRPSHIYTAESFGLKGGVSLSYAF